MSKIEVNQISSQCGSTLTIGQSGDTVTLASGATQTGFGRTGTVDWDTTAKTTNFTAVSGNGYFVNTTSGAITVTLPASPSAGDIVAVSDYNNTAETNAITIARNGSNINGDASDLVITKNSSAVDLVYVDATVGWHSVSTSNTSDVLNPFITATGGTIVTSGDYKIHTFTGPGTFTVTNVGTSAGSNTVDYLVVAGGGGGGGECSNYGGAGGGGAGGLRIGAVTPSPTHSPLVTTGLPVSASAYPITVGAGGTAGPVSPPGNGGNGGNSIFSTITSTGGGGGGKSVSSPTSIGNPGGSGGGAASPGNAGTGNTPPVSPPQGNPGGTGGDSAGGGGATAAGGNGPSPAGNCSGGNGLSVVPVFGAAPQPFYIANGPDNGASACGQFAGGGAGGHDPNPASSPGFRAGGIGGGANSPKAAGAGITGTGNTGGGGSGGGADVGSPSGPGVGAAGGSGIVIIRYKYQ